MKITFVMPVVKQNGGCRVVAIYAEKLLAMGHDVRVISRRPEPVTLKRYLGAVMKRKRRATVDPNRTVYFESLGERHVQIPWKWPLDRSDVPDADVIIATWWRTAFEIADLPPEKGAKAYFVQGYEAYDDSPFRDLASGSYWLPLKKIVIAGGLLERMADRYGDPTSVLVPNSVDLDRFTAGPRRRNDPPTVGFMYSAKLMKNTGLALEAVARVRKTWPDLRVVAFGDTDPQPDLPLPRGAVFHKLPRQEDIPGIYGQCDAWLMSSRLEGFGLPLLEAMACRTPVIATRTGAAQDFIEDGVNGFVVDVGAVDDMAARLADVLSCPAEAWQKMSEAARARVSMYTWDDAAHAFEAALKDIVGEASA